MEFYDRALRSREKVGGPETFEVGTTLHHMGDVRQEQGRLEEAMKLYERALRILEK